jgi:hypothetical protein
MSRIRATAENTKKLRTFFAAGQGLEPQYLAPEASVLPLDEPAILSLTIYHRKTEVVFTSHTPLVDPAMWSLY